VFKPFDVLAERVLDGAVLDRREALDVLAAPDAEVVDLVAAAGRVRRAYFGNLVKVNYLLNLRSGLCPEDCGYCSQRLGSTAEILTYSWLSTDEAVRQAAAGIAGGATRICLVSSGRAPATGTSSGSRRSSTRCAQTIPTSRSAPASGC
jgi:biotin synthase